MNPLRLLGHLLLWCGFFAGAFVAVQKVEVTSDKWSAIAWPSYAMALAVGVVGVFLLRATQRLSATHADKLEGDIQVLEDSVAHLLARLAELIKTQEYTDVYSVHTVIDARMMQSISNFVDARETLIHTYGLRQYAELMTDFSIAERNVNRAWSASADGYPDEVLLSLKRAQARLQSVSEHLAQYKKQETLREARS